MRLPLYVIIVILLAIFWRISSPNPDEMVDLLVDHLPIFSCWPALVNCSAGALNISVGRPTQNDQVMAEQLAAFFVSAGWTL